MNINASHFWNTKFLCTIKCNINIVDIIIKIKLSNNK